MKCSLRFVPLVSWRVEVVIKIDQFPRVLLLLQITTALDELSCRLVTGRGNMDPYYALEIVHEVKRQLPALKKCRPIRSVIVELIYSSPVRY